LDQKLQENDQAASVDAHADTAPCALCECKDYEPVIEKEK
jgi:hypothetical protein